MSETQLYLSLGLPVLAILIGILVNSNQVNTLNARMTSLQNCMTNLEGRFDTRMGALESKFDAKFDLLIGKVIELDTRLTRVEERLSH
jgi:hypothetical protein